MGIANKDNQWTSFELPEPLCIKKGALVSLRYNGYLSVLADAGVKEIIFSFIKEKTKTQKSLFWTAEIGFFRAKWAHLK